MNGDIVVLHLNTFYSINQFIHSHDYWVVYLSGSLLVFVSGIVLPLMLIFFKSKIPEFEWVWTVDCVNNNYSCPPIEWFHLPLYYSRYNWLGRNACWNIVQNSGQFVLIIFASLNRGHQSISWQHLAVRRRRRLIFSPGAAACKRLFWLSRCRTGCVSARRSRWIVGRTVDIGRSLGWWSEGEGAAVVARSWWRSGSDGRSWSTVSCRHACDASWIWATVLQLWLNQQIERILLL